MRTTFETHLVNEPPPIPSPFGEPTAIQKQNSSAVAKGILFGCGGCLVILVGMFAVFAAIFFISFSGLAHSAAVAEAVSRASASPRIQKALGKPIERDWFTTGNIEISNGDSSADVRIPIKGPNGSATIHAVGYKRQGEKWVFTVLEVTVTGTDERINLLQSAEAEQTA